VTPGGAEGARQVLRNAVHLLLAYVIPRLFTVVSVIVAARALGTERFGGYGAAAAFAVILSVLASLGMLPLLVREIARAPQRAGTLLATAHRIKAATGAAMLLIAWIVTGVWFAEDPGPRLAAMVLCVGWVVHAFVENVAAYYQAIERMARWTQASSMFGLVSSVVGVALLLWTDSIVAYCWGFVAGWACGLGWLIVGLPAEARRSAPGETAPVAELLRGLAPFAAAFIGLTIYCKVDVLMLERWSDAQAGLYTAAYKFVDVFQALVIVAAGAVYPRLSRAGAKSSRSEGGKRSAELLLLGALPAGLTLHLISAPLVLLVFGAGYGDAAPVLSRLALLFPLLSLTILGSYILGAVGRMTHVAVLYGIGLAANVGLNIWLIPELGAVGASVARLASETILVAGFLEVLRREAAALPGPRTLTVALSAAAAAALIGRMPDPSDGWLRGGAFLLVLLVIYRQGQVWRTSGFSTVLGALLRRGSPSPARAEAA
jgi:O-antigen/teichoic acid export membrane protein